jgi:hypothetical protein
MNDFMFVSSNNRDIGKARRRGVAGTAKKQSFFAAASHQRCYGLAFFNALLWTL